MADWLVPAMTQAEPLPLSQPMSYAGHETAGQCGLVPNQLTKMRMGRQRNVAALYLLRQIGMVECARYVERRLGALHSGHRAS